MAKSEKSFTLIELLIAGIVFAFLGMAAGSLFYLHGKMIKNITESSGKNLEAQTALSHIIENVQSSAWVTVLDSNNIELHSNYHPDIRKYSLQNGILKYEEGTKASMVLARNIDANMLFVGVGNQKPINRFQKIKIEFWTKDGKGLNYSDMDKFYAQVYAVSKESWDLIYVDPVNATSTQDGTKRFPFSTLDGALNIAVGGQVYPNEKMLVLSGNHEISGDISIVLPIIFTKSTMLDFSSGAIIRMGQNINLYIRGGFSCGEGVTITPLFPSSMGGIIYIASQQESFVFKHINLSGAIQGIAINSGNFPRKEKSPFSVTISNSSIYDTYGGFSVNGAQYLQINDNTFDNNQNSVLSISNDNASPGTIRHLIYGNSFGKGSWLLNIYLSTNPDQTLIQEIYNNTFERKSSDYSGIPINYSSYGNGLIQTRIYNNIMTGSELNPAGALSCIRAAWANNANPSSQLLIDHNTIDNKNRGGCGIIAVYSSMPILIENNNIMNNKSYGIWVWASGKVAIENNILHDNNYNLYLDYPYWYNTYAGDVNIENNIFYGKGAIYSSLRYGSYARLINNTITSGAVSGSGNWEIRNSIIWGDNTKVDKGLEKFISYSNVKGMTADLSKGIISEAPPFRNAAKFDYALDLSGIANSQQWTGSDGTEIGAYGGKHLDGWASGVGIQNEKK